MFSILSMFSVFAMFSHPGWQMAQLEPCLQYLQQQENPSLVKKVSPKVGDFHRGQDRRWVTRLWLHSQDKRHPLAKVDNTQWASLEQIVFFLAVFQPRDQRKMESKRRDVYVSSLYFWLHSIPCQNWCACLMCQSPQNWNWKKSRVWGQETDLKKEKRKLVNRQQRQRPGNWGKVADLR